MNTVADLLQRADRVLDAYGQSVRSRNYSNVVGFTSALIELYRRKPDPKHLGNILVKRHPRPQLQGHWKAYGNAVKGEIQSLSEHPELVLRFLGYLKRKAHIRSKASTHGTKHRNKGRR